MRDARPGTTPPKPKQRARRGAGAVGAQMGRPARSVRPSRDPSLRAAQGSFSREQAAARAALAHPHHTHVLRSLDTGASYVVGTRPSQIPHNVVQGVESIVPGTHAYSEAHHSRAWAMAHPEALRQTEHNVGIVPWGPFGKGLRGARAGQKAALEAAGMHSTAMISMGEDVETAVRDAAQRYNVPERALHKHLHGGKAKTDQRAYGNRQHWQNTVKLNDLEQQVPEARSKITRGGQRAYSRHVSDPLAPVVEQLRTSDRPLDRAAARALNPISSRMRAAKYAGKWGVKQEIRRANAGLKESADAVSGIGKTGPIKHEGEQLAQTLYAQLPEDRRSLQGLKDLRARLEAETLGEKDPTVIVDRRAMIAKINRVIEKGVEPNHDAIVQMGVINSHSEDILQRSGLLDPETAQVRRGLLTRYLEGTDTVRSPDGQTVERLPGQENYHTLEREAAQHETILRGEQRRLKTLERRLAKRKAAGSKRPSPALEARIVRQKEVVARWAAEHQTALQRRDELGPQIQPLQDRGEVFVPHRIAGKRHGRLSGASFGKTRTPEGIAKENRLILFRTGRAQLDPEAVLRHHASAQAYEFHNIAKNLLHEMGTTPSGNEAEVLGQIRDAYSRGDYILNREGHKIPRSAKVRDVEQALAEGFDSDVYHSVIKNDTEEYLRNYLAQDPSDAERMIEHATGSGNLKDLRIIPRDVAHKFYSQFLPRKVRKGIQGLESQPGKFAKTADLYNDIVYTGLIWGNPGYIPANTVANLIMAGVQQGAFLPSNISRAMQIVFHGPPELRNRILAEVGEGGSRALASSTSPLRRAGGVVNSIADNPYRISSFLHEAAAEGVIPKLKPWLDKEDYAKLKGFLTKPQNRDKLNNVRWRAEQAMVDFDTMPPEVKQGLNRIVFVSSWLAGGSKYPFRFALDHPLRSAILAYIASGEPGSPHHFNRPVTDFLATGMPPWLENAINTGQTMVDDKEFPTLLPTNAISPVSTPWQLAKTFADSPGSQTVGEMLNPGITAAWYTAHKQDPYGGDIQGSGPGPYLQSAEQNYQRIAPQEKLAKELLHPQGGGMYPEDATRLGRLKRALRVFPIAVDPAEAYKARKRLGMAGDHYETAKHDLMEQSKKAGMGMPPHEVFDDLHWKTLLDHQTHKKNITWSERLQATVKLYDERYHDHLSADLKDIGTEGEAKAYYEKLRPALYPYYSQWAGRAKKGATAEDLAQPVSH